MKRLAILILHWNGLKEELRMDVVASMAVIGRYIYIYDIS
jgi:hypothetical protein